MATPICTSCGAPEDSTRTHCNYCRAPYSAEVLASAVPCPNPACRAVYRAGRDRCAACNAWLIVACVFCGKHTPHNQQACSHCGEAFQGAHERIAARNQEQSHAQTMDVVSAVAPVAAMFLGGVVGSLLDDD